MRRILLISLRLKINSKVPLQGAELEEYLARERAAKEKEAAKKAAEDRRQRILEADAEDTDEGDNEYFDGRDATDGNGSSDWFANGHGGRIANGNDAADPQARQ